MCGYSYFMQMLKKMTFTYNIAISQTLYCISNSWQRQCLIHSPRNEIVNKSMVFELVATRELLVQVSWPATEVTPSFYPPVKALQLPTGLYDHCYLKETIQRFFHCPSDTASRSNCFTSRRVWKEKIVTVPLDVLEHMRREGGKFIS